MANSFTYINVLANDDVYFEVHVNRQQHNPEYIHGDITLKTGYRDAQAHVTFSGTLYKLKLVSEVLALACKQLEEEGKLTSIEEEEQK